MTKAASINVHGIRTMRLDATGAPKAGAGNLHVHGAPIQFPIDPQYQDRETYRQPIADGTDCVVYEGPPRGIDTTQHNGLQLCEWDEELLEMLVGGVIFTGAGGGSAVAGSGGTDPGITRGWIAPTDDTAQDDGVAMELWTKAWTGTSRLLIDGLPAWNLWVFPKITWQLAAVTLERGVHVCALNGTGVRNDAFGDGPFNELPIPITGPFAKFQTTTGPPTPTGGYATLTPV